MGSVDRVGGRESHPSAGELRASAARMRALDLVSIYAAGSGHPGGTLSVMDLAAVLFLDEVRYDPADPRWDGRDRAFFSAGHKAPALYAGLVEAGYYGEKEAATLRKLGSPFQGHPHAPLLPGLEVSSGSLGQGLGIAVGCALAGRISGKPYRVYCVMGDGEQQEGSVWEAAMAASHHCLGNLCAIIDKNGLQIDGRVDSVMRVDPLAAKYEAFGWNAICVDGHDIEAIRAGFARARLVTGQALGPHRHDGEGQGRVLHGKPGGLARRDHQGPRAAQPGARGHRLRGLLRGPCRRSPRRGGGLPEGRRRPHRRDSARILPRLRAGTRGRV